MLQQCNQTNAELEVQLRIIPCITQKFNIKFFLSSEKETKNINYNWVR